MSNLAYGTITSPALLLDGAATVDVTGTVRGVLVGGGVALEPAVVRARVEFYDDTGTKLGQHDRDIDPATLTAAWAPFTDTRVVVPAGAVSATVEAKALHIDGWVAFDDLDLTIPEVTSETVHYPGVGYATDGQLTITVVDHLGSPIGSWTPDAPAGEQAGARRYLPFGGVRGADGIDTSIGYTGQRADPASGLMYYGARWYDPALSRFVQADTIVPDAGRSGDLDRYAYVRNNPYGYTDPTGHTPCAMQSCPDGAVFTSQSGTARPSINLVRQPSDNSSAVNKLLYCSRCATSFAESKSLADARPPTVTSAIVGGLAESFVAPISCVGYGEGAACKRAAIDLTITAATAGVGKLAKVAWRARSASRAVAVATPYGPAAQATSQAARIARADVADGATLWRVGTSGRSSAADAQFWSLEHPLTPGFASRYGIPPENVLNADFIESAVLRPGSPFVTRVAPGVGSNLGGGIEAVVPEGGVWLRGFSIFGPKGAM